MNEYVLAHASDDTPEALAMTCAERLRSASGHTLGLVYVTHAIADAMQEIVAILSAQTGITNWLGTAGIGICATGASYFGRPAIVVMTTNWRPEHYEFVSTVISKDELGFRSQSGLVAALGIVHADPRNPDAAEILESLSERSGTFLVGGVTAARTSFPQVAGQITEGGVSGLLLGGRMNVTVGLTQGCTPIGPTHRVTRGAGNILITLDDFPALEVLREEVGVADGADLLPWLADVHAALPISGSDNADYLVRNLMGIDQAQNMVVIAERVTVGERVTFVRRDAESARKDMQRMLGDLKERTTFQPKAGLYYSCCARGPNLFDDEHEEMSAIGDAFGDIPIIGFFGNGEISHNRIYGYTGVLTLFS